MITCKQGEVVLIPFPFTDLSSSKQRPALIISSDRFNDLHHDVVVMAITSQVPSQLSPYEYLFSPFDQKAAGLPKKSIIKLGKLVTINKRLVRKRLGALSKPTVSLLLDSFMAVLGR